MEPGCDTNGEERRNCQNCDHYETRETSPEHRYESGVCTVCGSLKPSDGLQLTLGSLNDVMFYKVVGVGTCNDSRIVIPSVYNGLPVKVITNSAFKNCSDIQEVIIPDSITSIENYAFYNCSNLRSVIISEKVVSIGSYSFYGCTSMSSITISASVAIIGDYAFSDCTALTTINYVGTAEQWNSISKGTYWNCNMNSYTINYNYVAE